LRAISSDSYSSYSNDERNQTLEKLVRARSAKSNTRDIPEVWIEVAAYYIWEKEGRPHGRHLDHWNLAKAELAGLSKLGNSLATKQRNLPASPKRPLKQA
jgi:hypothetical protein